MERVQCGQTLIREALYCEGRTGVDWTGVVSLGDDDDDRGEWEEEELGAYPGSFNIEHDRSAYQGQDHDQGQGTGFWGLGE